jgi:ATP-dependent protease Clp ATPase subunit
VETNTQEKPWWDDRATINAENTVTNTYDEKLFSTPKSIYAYFDSKIYGCDQYKKKMSVAIWSAIHRRTKTNFLIIGESGCGKTELARVLKEIYPNTVIYDSSNASPKAFRGNNTLTDCLIGIDETTPAFIFIDEFDKCISKGSEVGPMMQSEILKLAEGAQVYVGEDKNRKLVDTSLINFVFMGTFADLKKEREVNIGFNSSNDSHFKESPITKADIIDSNALSNEFLGRINGGIIQLPAMTPERAKAILSDARYSPVKRLEEQYGITISLSIDKIDELANMSTEYGVRGIYSELQEKLCDVLFEDSNASSVSI